MALEIKQNLKLTQQLVITPQLQQAIKLLQLSHLDLVEQIQAEMIENPALEEIPGTTPTDSTDAESKLVETTKAETQDVVDQNNGKESQETDWEKVLESYSSSNFKTGSTGGSSFDDLPPIESTLRSSDSLAQHLLWQLKMQHCTDEEKVCAVVIIQNLDERGYLAISLDQVAEEVRDDFEVDVHIDDVEGAQMIVQGLEPNGCGSSGLAQCLAVQARVLHPEDPTMVQIIEQHLEDFERRNYQAVSRALDLELEDVIEYHRMIRELEPRPGRGYSDAEPQYITPDVYVFKVGEEWQVLLNEDGLPKLRVSPYYQRVLKDGGPKDEKAYIKEKLDSAEFLIKSIYKRQGTINKVVKCILERQQDFFDMGIDHLRPMVLRDVADEIGVHESTVSRVTSNKYMQCPQGILELKFFFNAGIQRERGEDVAAAMVKNKIKQLIAAEDPKKPMSDSALVKELSKHNIKCARRTVAKYREAMGILASSKRRNLF